MPDRHEHCTTTAPSPLGPTLVVTFLLSIGTGVFWNAIPFVAKHAYGFGLGRNLLLASVMGFIYTVGAFRSGAITRWAARWCTPRQMIAIILVVQAIACLGPVTIAHEAALWGTAAIMTFTASILWPLIEAYLTAGRHGAAMRSAIGSFNIVWMTAVAVPLLAMPPILEHHAEWAIGAQTGVSVLTLLFLVGFAPAPAPHDPVSADHAVPPGYGELLRCARVLLPLSYFLLAAMSPILPYRFEVIGADVMQETPATATWMLVRVGCVVIMSRLAFWHGRWGTLLLGAVLMTGGFGVVVLAPRLPIMLVGFGAFGAGMGIVYYAALYYAMAVGRAEVDAGGTHEGLIGGGYTIGPLVGLAGMGIARVLIPPVAEAQVIVGMVWATVALAGAAAARPYRRARAARRGAS